jgi:hypothetical protein
MDTGPQRPGEAAAMFDAAYASGIRRLVAAPHYDCGRESVPEFLVRRRSAYLRLRDTVGKEFDRIKLFLSCEAILQPEIASTDELPLLTIPGTNLLPLAIPPGEFIPDVLMREIVHLVQKRGICPLYCHIERYFSLFGPRFSDFLLQTHAAFLVSPRAFSDSELVAVILRAIRHGARILLGSNAHDTEHLLPYFSPPALGGMAHAAYRIISESTDELLLQCK